MGRWLKAGRAWIERGLLEKVVGRGFIEQRLDVALKRLVSGARIVEELGPALRRQRQRFVKQSFDVQPVLWIHRTPSKRDQMVAYRAAREGLPPGCISTPEKTAVSGHQRHKAVRQRVPDVGHRRQKSIFRVDHIERRLRRLLVGRI